VDVRLPNVREFAGDRGVKVSSSDKVVERSDGRPTPYLIVQGPLANALIRPARALAQVPAETERHLQLRICFSFLDLVWVFKLFNVKADSVFPYLSDRTAEDCLL